MIVMNHYRGNISSFTTWCEDHWLSLNVKKTKELVIDFRIKKNPLSPLVIKDQEIEQVQTYKYLGVIIDDKLNWQMHSSAVCKKLNRRMFFLRKLRSLKNRCYHPVIVLSLDHTKYFIILYCSLGMKHHI